METKKKPFQKLTPSADINIEGYEKAFDFIFENSDLKNVAITGPYSAGKSSVLASYKKKHSVQQEDTGDISNKEDAIDISNKEDIVEVSDKENKIIKFIHISLAHYESPDEDKENTSESVLEGKILNQLIHQIPPNDIPQTNFRIKEKIEDSTVKRISIWMTAFIFSTIYLIFLKPWSQYVYSFSYNFDVKLLLNFFTVCLVLFMMVSIAFFIFHIVKIQKNKNIFRKFNFQGNEIELFEDEEDSYFDKYLNEVLYIFDSVDADVIVFEDLDRFNVNKVFERLKEVNVLVNLHRKKEGEDKKPLRFFYLLRDDIFLSKDRTKFFDFIIPIVPVLDTSNSYDQLIYHLETGEYIKNFNKNFLQEISLYIDDMRILKNIYNEFIIYIDTIDNIASIELDYNKMFSIITYKNLFPKDFSSLQLNRGFVASIFINQENLKKQKIDSLEKNLTIETNNDKNKEAIIKIKKELITTKNLSLVEMINRNNIDEIFMVTTTDVELQKDFDRIKDSDYFDLLKYLIRNGHIDETYNDYMSYFYEGSLSVKDKIFLRSITDKRTKSDFYKLNNVKQVVSYLNTGSFTQEEILNHDILSYLLTNADSYPEFLETFILQLKETVNFKFLQSFLGINKEIPKFTLLLNELWPQMLSVAIKDSNLTEDEIFSYSLYTFYHSSESTIKNMNEDNCLTEYISNNSEYINIKDPNIKKLTSGFSVLDIKFKNIDYKKANTRLLKAIYTESFYEINFKNLLLIVTELFEVSCEEDMRHKNYTVINQLTDHNLLGYINEHIDTYIEVVLSSCNNKINDEENSALMLLNNEDISDEYKDKYMNYLETKITSVEDINDEQILETLLTKKLIVYSEKNILAYYNENQLSPTLIDFINSEQTPLDFFEAATQYDAKFANDLFVKITLCNELDDAKYEDILVSLDHTYETMIDVSTLVSSKFEILVKNKILPMNAQGLAFVRSKIPDSVSYYIKNNIEKYTDIITVQNFNFTELLEILSSEEPDETKIKLLKLTKTPISIVEQGYTKKVVEHILQNNLNIKELPYLFTSYSKWDSKIKKIIENIAVLQINHTISHSESLPQKLITNLFVSQTLDRKFKLSLLLSLAPTSSKTEVQEYLEILELPNYSNVFKLHARVVLEIDPFNKSMLDIFKERKWIKNFEKKTDGKLEYQVYKKSNK